LTMAGEEAGENIKVGGGWGIVLGDKYGWLGGRFDAGRRKEVIRKQKSGQEDSVADTKGREPRGEKGLVI